MILRDCLIALGTWFATYVIVSILIFTYEAFNGNEVERESKRKTAWAVSVVATVFALLRHEHYWTAGALVIVNGFAWDFYWNHLKNPNAEL